MLFIQKSNDFILLLSFVCIVLIAEIASTIGLFLIAKGYFLSGIFFYVLKIVIYIPSIDIFKRNKSRLLKYKIIQIGVWIYEKIEKNPYFIQIKNRIKLIKENIYVKIKEMKIILKNYWRKLWKTL